MVICSKSFYTKCSPNWITARIQYPKKTTLQRICEYSWRHIVALILPISHLIGVDFRSKIDIDRIWLTYHIKCVIFPLSVRVNHFNNTLESCYFQSVFAVSNALTNHSWDVVCSMELLDCTSNRLGLQMNCRSAVWTWKLNKYELKICCVVILSLICNVFNRNIFDLKPVHDTSGYIPSLAYKITNIVWKCVQYYLCGPHYTGQPSVNQPTNIQIPFIHS